MKHSAVILDAAVDVSSRGMEMSGMRWFLSKWRPEEDAGRKETMYPGCSKGNNNTRRGRKLQKWEK